jgi:3-phenylpropionate/trans-cinnamate dioxygenase ferredoxin reductase component
MTNSPTLVVIGASVAGAKAAEAARDAGHDGRIVLIGEEATAPYERPPLSKAVLRGEAELNVTHVHPDGFYAQHDIELVYDRVAALDPRARTVQLDAGEDVPFDTLVLATGAAPRRLRVPGAELGGVHLLRTADDAIGLRDAIRAATRVAVVGAGWIGSEVAASARQMGADVVLIDPAPVPLHRILGDEVGGVFRTLHSDNGVTLRMSTTVTEIRGVDSVEALVLDDGRVETADVVVIGVGVTPQVEIAERAGLLTDNGLVVDERLATNVAGIFAAGDVANAWHPHYQRHLRVEHWANALNQGITAGHNAAGNRDSYTRLPYFFSDQYDLGLEYVGHSNSGDAVTIRGDRDSRQFIAFWHHDGIITAAMNVNVWDVVDDLKALIETRTPIDPALLTDLDTPIAELARLNVPEPTRATWSPWSRNRADGGAIT